jgi:hypothetical protein
MRTPTGSRALPARFHYFLLMSALALPACRYEPSGLRGIRDGALGTGAVDAGVPQSGADGGFGPTGIEPGGSNDACGTVCEPAMKDGCCPVGCTGATDVDCAGTCGNGILETGEQCDPQSSCPGACPNRGCTQFKLEGNAEDCTAICVELGKQTECVSGDGCCAPGCNGSNDDDCLVQCNDGIKQGNETCDPLASCPTSCPALGCQLRTLVNAGTCAAECVNERQQTACVSGDGCCPPGCNRNSDADCGIMCGNMIQEGDETCDPLSACPNACPPQGCQLRKLVNPGTCFAQCVKESLQTACVSGDDCCPDGCNNNSDKDCDSACGNMIKEKGETCDPLASCPTSCPPMGCQLRELVNAGTCRASCQNARMQTACASGDGCCPAGCNNNNDSDCKIACGNGVVEKGETCEPVSECTRRQMACQSDQNTIRTGRGNPATCTFECAQSPRACGPADGSCPAGCVADPDCGVRPTNCVHIEWCKKPNAPDAGKVICRTDDDARCAPSERAAECARDARTVCGAGHVKPIEYRPAIAGKTSG